MLQHQGLASAPPQQRRPPQLRSAAAASHSPGPRKGTHYLAEASRAGLCHVRLQTFPPMMITLCCILLLEAVAINWISTPSEFERQLGLSGYAVEYHDTLVVERAQELLQEWDMSQRNHRPIYHHRTPIQTVPPLPYHDFRNLYEQKVELDEPWWISDYPTRPPSRFLHSCWVTRDKERPSVEVAELIKRLPTLCASDSYGWWEAEGHRSFDPEVERRVILGQPLNAAQAAMHEQFETSLRQKKNISASACEEAVAIAQSLASTLAREKAERFALSVEKQLLTPRDLLHDTLYHKCVDKPELPHSPQGCVDRLWLRVFLTNVAVHWAIAIIIVTLVWRAMLCYEYVIAHRLATTLIGSHGVRTTCFVATSLPMMNLRCRTQFTAVSNGGGCGDYLFSGHAVVMVSCLLMMFHQHAISAPRWPLWLLCLLTLCFGVVTFGYALERWHYTVDILLALYVTPVLWSWSGHLWGSEVVGSQRTWWVTLPQYLLSGRTVQLSHLVVFLTILLTTLGVALVGTTAPWIQADALFGSLLGLLVSVCGLCFITTERLEKGKFGEWRTPSFCSHPALLCDRLFRAGGVKYEAIPYTGHKYK
jgi:hypothetical protein